MRIYCIGCEVLARPIYASAATSPHTIDVEMLRYGLHQKPGDLRSRIQALVDAAEGYDGVVLAYGLCGKALEGLQARGTRMVLPRAHDCITLFLGSRERYRQQFEQFPGTYWYAQDYLERDDGSGVELAIGANTSGDAEAVYAEYAAKYGADNADYLMQVMGAWQQHYQRAAYIDLGLGSGAATEARARQDAQKRGWRFERLVGSDALIRRLLHGEWGDGSPSDDFLVLAPGQAVRMSFDDGVVSASP